MDLDYKDSDFPIEYKDHDARPSTIKIPFCPFCNNTERFDVELGDKDIEGRVITYIVCGVCKARGPNKLRLFHSTVDRVNMLEIAYASGWSKRVTDEEYEQLRADNLNLQHKVCGFLHEGLPFLRWRGMDQAPYNGTYVLLVTNKTIWIGRWNSDGGRWISYDGRTGTPIAWMPLPALPDVRF